MLDKEMCVNMIEVNAITNKKQLDKMKKVLRATSERDYLLFVVGINVGLRISDLLELKIGNMINKNEVTILEGKTKKTRTFTINKTVKLAINEYLSTLDDYNDTDYLFKSRKGVNKPISRVQAWQVLSDSAKLVGITEPIGTHTLRKTFGYWSYKQGIDISLLQDIFNHSSSRITLRYIGITKKTIEDVYNNLNL